MIRLGALRKFGIYTKAALTESFMALGQKHLKKLRDAAAQGDALDVVWGVLTAGVVLLGEAAVAVRKAKSEISDAEDATARDCLLPSSRTPCAASPPRNSR